MQEQRYIIWYLHILNRISMYDKCIWWLIFRHNTLHPHYSTISYSPTYSISCGLHLFWSKRVDRDSGKRWNKVHTFRIFLLWWMHSYQATHTYIRQSSVNFNGSETFEINHTRFRKISIHGKVNVRRLIIVVHVI